MLSVDAISFEDRFCASKKGGVGRGGRVSAQGIVHMVAALAGCSVNSLGQHYMAATIWVCTQPGLWTLDWTMHCTMDWIMDSILDLIVFQFCNSTETMNAGLPNEQGIDISRNTHFCSFQQDWFKPSLCSYNLPAHLVGKDS